MLKINCTSSTPFTQVSHSMISSRSDMVFTLHFVDLEMTTSVPIFAGSDPAKTMFLR